MKTIFLCILVLTTGSGIFAQDYSVSKLRLSYSLLDFPQNFDTPGNYPSMIQSVELSGDLYDIGFWSINALGNLIFRKQTGFRKVINTGFKYLVGFGFSYYGSELPIPLGVYTHEEFHRSVLGASGYKSKNGNWILSRWDGTVYGMSDEDLTELKRDDPTGLLYSYVAGVQSENFLIQLNTIQDLYHSRAFYKGPLYLYNAYYLWNYFRFSTSPASDSVRLIAPQYEDSDPYYRDYAGADLTAWIYDMFHPDVPYTGRDPFPEGDGVNRRIGFSELDPDGQEYLVKQKNLSLLNFINPAIFLINRIQISEEFQMMFFMQYNPTHFGNDIALYLPVKIRSVNHLLAIHNYNNREKSYPGIQYGLYNVPVVRNGAVEIGSMINLWMQPLNQGFDDRSGKFGGALELTGSYRFAKGTSIYFTGTYKSAGWMIGNPYLERTLGLRFGLSYTLHNK
jgi:hypothetical protein